MRRHPALAGLARDHHQALAVALTLRRAQEHQASLEHVRRALRRFVEGGGAGHFAREEQILLPAFAAHGPADHPLVARTLIEHVVLRRGIADVLDAGRDPGDATASARALGRDLEAHVRLEERELFVLVEQTMPEAALEQLGRRMAGSPTTARSD